MKVEISSRKNMQERRIDELVKRLDANDVLLVAKLSRLGRNMFGVINITNALREKGVEIVFVQQPELSTAGLHRELLLAVCSYLTEVEREFASIHTIINSQLEKPICYDSYQYFVRQDEALLNLWQAQKKSQLASVGVYGGVIGIEIISFVDRVPNWR